MNEYSQGPDGPDASHEQAGPLGIDRRVHPRHNPAVFRLWIGRWNNRDFSILASRLLDISQGGAALITAEAPPEGQTVWLCLHDAREAGTVRAEVLGVHRQPEGVHKVRLRFLEEVPEPLFEIAVGLVEAV